MRISTLASIIVYLGSTGLAQAYPLTCKDNASAVTLKLENNSGSDSLTELSAELTGLRHWDSALSFKMRKWGLDGWRFSHAYNGASGTLLLNVSHLDSEAHISVSEFDCRGSKIGEPCKVQAEKIEMICTKP